MKKRDGINNLIRDLEKQIKENNKILDECTQQENDLTLRVKNLPYNLDEIEIMIQKPDRIREEIEIERNNIENMKKEINDNEMQFRTQCEALVLIANDLNGIADELNVGNSIKINDSGENTDELFSANIEEIVQNILSKKPDINKIEIENAKISNEKNEIDAEMMRLKKEEEELLSKINSIKDSNGKDVDKVNKKLNDIQKENKKLTREIQSNDDSVKGLFTKLDDKFKSVSNHISSKLAEYLDELRKVQEEI